MEKYKILVLFLVFSYISFGQNMIEEIGNKTCECINNNEENISFDEKFQKCVISEKIKYADANKEQIKKETPDFYTVERIRKIIFDIKTYMEENCDANIITNKTLDLKGLKSVSNDVCNCIKKIDINLKSKNDSIKECIDSKLMNFQLINMIGKVDLDNTSTKIQPKKVNINIVTGNKSKIYKQVETELLANCSELKKLLMNNNSDKHINSMTFNLEANENYNIGSNFSQNREYDKAIPYLEEAVRLDSKFAYAWDNLGLSYRHTKQYSKAINAYETSMKIDPLGKTPIMNIGVVYEKIKDYDKAIVAYNKYINLLKNDPEGYYGLGRMYLFKKKYDLSLKNIIKAYRLYVEQNSPYRSDAINVMKQIYQSMKADNKVDEFNKLAKKYNLNIN